MFFFLIILIVNQLSFSQDKVADSCDLKNKNVEWKTSFKIKKQLK